MKVGCQQCGASYSVADEKVAGRKLKLRCKKCGEPMLIDASAQDSQPFGPTFQVVTPEASDAPAAPVETEWFVGIEDQAQGPYTLEEVQSHYATGLIAADTLVFREGLSAWTRAEDVAELQARRTSSMLPPPPRPPSVPPSRAQAAFAGAASLDAEVPMGRDPFADSAPPLSPRVGAAELLAVGPQRDGTVQFSLDDIRALSAVSSPGSSPPPPLKVGYAGGDDSGLIDMRSLAQTAGEQDAYRAIGSELQSSPLDTMRPFALPVQAQRGGVDFRTKVLAGVASFGFLLAGGVGVLALTRAPQPQAAVQSANQTPARASAAAVTSPATPAMAAIVGAGAAADVKPAAAEAAPESARTVESAVEPEERAVKGRRRAPHPLTRSDTPAPERAAAKASGGTDIDDILAKSPPKSEPVAAKAEKPSASKGGDDLDALLLGAIDGKKSAPKPAAEPAQDTGGKTPSRDEVRAALFKAKAKTANCKGTGVAMADITIANTGRVTNVSVSGVEGAAKACVETAVRSTPFPKFEQPTFAVKFPFKLN